jgi:hypothetical protein
LNISIEDRIGIRGISRLSIKVLFGKKSFNIESSQVDRGSVFLYNQRRRRKSTRDMDEWDLRLDDTDDKRYVRRLLFLIKMVVIKMTMVMSKKKASRLIIIERVQLVVLWSEIEKLANLVVLFTYCIVVFSWNISKGVLVFDCRTTVVISLTFIEVETIVSVVELGLILFNDPIFLSSIMYQGRCFRFKMFSKSVMRMKPPDMRSITIWVDIGYSVDENGLVVYI